MSAEMSANLAAWASVAIGLLSLVVAVLTLAKAKSVAIKVDRLEAQILQISQVAIHQPVLFGGAGGGGGGGAGGGAGGAGGGVAYQPTQSFEAGRR